MMDPNAAFYKHRPIASVEALARTLREPAEHLRDLAQRADDMYRGPIPQEKRDGTIRFTYDAYTPLKRVHEKIQTQLLREVYFPDYLMGGLQDPDGIRGYIKNAQNHAGARLLVGEDAEDFFPSVSFEHVRAIFRHVFHFPDSVATLLAKICTRRGSLAQGAKTSTYLANLALFRVEPELYRKLSAMGVSYSRFIDDMHGSSHRRMDSATRTQVVSLIRGALERTGFRPKRKKQFVRGAGSAMQVHRLNVTGAASKDRGYRKNIRAAIHSLESMVARKEFNADFDTLLRSAVSRTAGIVHLNPGDAHRFRFKLSLMAIEYRQHRRRIESERARGF
jgi:hypothetical protein